jgi:hypothetical protein
MTAALLTVTAAILFWPGVLVLVLLIWAAIDFVRGQPVFQKTWRIK